MTVTYVWQCGFCTGHDTQTYSVSAGGEAPRSPVRPEGWAVLQDGRLVCAAHYVIVKSKDK